MITSRSTAAALAGTALAGLLAACGSGGATASGYSPLTASTPSPDATVDPMQGPAQLIPAATQGPAGQPAQPGQAGQPAKVVTPAQAKAPDYSALSRSFVALRNQDSQGLAAIKGQTSNSDLEVDKRLMAQAASIFSTYAQQLRALPWPASLTNDANALVSAVATVQWTFVQASQVASFNDLGPWLQKLIDTEDAQLTATNVVENDLHLPLSTPRP
jgi:hypothetical protein